MARTWIDLNVLFYCHYLIKILSKNRNVIFFLIMNWILWKMGGIFNDYYWLITTNFRNQPPLCLVSPSHSDLAALALFLECSLLLLLSWFPSSKSIITDSFPSLSFPVGCCLFLGTFSKVPAALVLFFSPLALFAFGNWLWFTNLITICLLSLENDAHGDKDVCLSCSL